MRTEIIQVLYGLGAVYDREIDDSLIQIWTAVLGELTGEEITDATRRYLLDPKNVYFPKPGQIYGLARQSPDLEQQASMIADRVFLAQSQYGSDRVGTERAKLKVGEIGWRYIEMLGGWDMFVKSVTSNSDIPILKAQARKSIMGLIQQGKYDNTTQLPSPEESIFKKIGLELKSIPTR